MNRVMLFSGLIVTIAMVVKGDNAAPADDLAQRKDFVAEIPTAPTEYRRPTNWVHNATKDDIPTLSRKYSAQVQARAAQQMKKVTATNAQGPYHATAESMDEHRCPEWFVDAKLGIFVDWGPWSLASWCPYVKGARLYPDWYEYRCRTDAKTIAYHKLNWGEDFASDDFLDLFLGQRFDAEQLMKVFKAAGARYVVPFLKHHGGFCLWDCAYTRRDTMDCAAHRDFAREMVEACRAQGLKFGLYTSQAGEWEYPILDEKGQIKIALNTPKKLVDYLPKMEKVCSGKIAVKDFVHDYIVPQTTEFIDRYDPDILWGDFDWMTRADENGSYEIAAYFYNRAAGRKEVACNDRCGCGTPEEVAKFSKLRHKVIGLRTIRGDFFTDEWGDTAADIDPAKWHPWESCSGISKAYGNHWMESFDETMVMTEREFIVHFADIVARGGNLLLMVNLDAQGALLSVQRKRLLQIGEWLQTYGEAIFETRICAPYVTANIDYTQSKDGKKVFAIVKTPSSEVTLECSLPATSVVRVVGQQQALPTYNQDGKTVVRLPSNLAQSKVPFALECTR